MEVRGHWNWEDGVEVMKSKSGCNEEREQHAMPTRRRATEESCDPARRNVSNDA